MAAPFVTAQGPDLPHFIARNQRTTNSQHRTTTALMDLQHAQDVALQYADFAATQIQKIPGSAIVIRYIQSSYQNDPVRSAIELLLFLFTVRYLLAPSYSTKKPNKVVLTEDVSGKRILNKGWYLINSCRKSMIWSKIGRRNRWSLHSHHSKKRRTRRDLL